jgi:hypothetical protein
MGDDSEIFVGIDVASQLLARALASISFNRSSSSRLTVTSLRASSRGPGEVCRERIGGHRHKRDSTRFAAKNRAGLAARVNSSHLAACGVCCDRSAWMLTCLRPFPTFSSLMRRLAPPAWSSTSGCRGRGVLIFSASSPRRTENSQSSSSQGTATSRCRCKR